MRIACVHVPQFALQCLGRIDPPLRGAAVAVVGAGFDPAPGARPSLALHSPIVLACSRAAWTMGVRLGMTASAARYASPDLKVVAADPALERETVRAIADALLGVSSVVDTGGRVAAGGAHLAMYCEVPSRTRGTVFGDRLLVLLDALGLAARIGIADDRFTAWVAAAHGGGDGVPRDRRADQESPRDADGGRRTGARMGDRGVVVVPRGGSAAFLAPRPLSLLAITAEVQHMLEALGVRTLGEFAELPAPSVSRPLEADYQALARGEGGSALRPYAPEAPVREDLVIGQTGRLFDVASHLSLIAERLAFRLAGRARGASRLEVTIHGGDEQRLEVVTADPPARTADDIAALLAPLIGEKPAPGTRMQVIVVGEAVAGGAAAAALAAQLAAVTEVARQPGEQGGVTPPAETPDAQREPDEAEQDEREDGDGEPDESAAPEELGQIVSLPGQPWHLAPTGGEVREGHRRTRRAKRRALAIGQAPLFGNVDRSG